MPRNSVVLAPRPIDARTLAVGASKAWAQLLTSSPDLAEFELLPIDEGAALQVRLDGVVLLTVLRGRLLPKPDEVARLLPQVEIGAVPDGSWWTDAYTPWSDEGLLGAAILELVAAEMGGSVEHSQRP
jgi:hypothetical protein